MALATFLKLSIVSKHSMALHYSIMKAKNAEIASCNASSQPERSAALRSVGNLRGTLPTQINIIIAQLPVSACHEMSGEATTADATLDCIIHNAHRIELKGESMCKKEKLTTLTDSEKAETIAP